MYYFRALLKLLISLLFDGALKSAWSRTDSIYFILHITYLPVHVITKNIL